VFIRHPIVFTSKFGIRYATSGPGTIPALKLQNPICWGPSKLHKMWDTSVRWGGLSSEVESWIHRAQDKLHLLGWPEMDTGSVSERELKSLTGEAIHLGCLSLCLGAVYCDPTASWWQVPVNCAPSGSANSSIVVSTQSGVGCTAQPKRRRRIGPVKSLT
jgi:hypothetical protein